MTNLKDLTTQQLKHIIDLKSQIEALESELDSIATGSAPRRGRPPGPVKTEGKLPGRPSSKGRKMSAAGRAAIAAAAKARWAAYRGEKVAETTKPAKPAKKKRTMSAAAKAKISAAAIERWKKAKAAGKSTL